MKKHLLFAGLICVATIPPANAVPAPASTVTKCVALNSNTTCTSESPGHYVADWTSTCTTNGVSTSIKGIGICSATRGASTGSTATSLEISGTTSENAYCWCKMVSPALSRWVCALEDLSAGNCAYLCADSCAGYAHVDASFRSALFGSLSD